MKKSIFILLIVLMMSGITACHDSVTNLTPESVLTEANFFQSSEDMEQAVIGVYANYQTRYSRFWTIFEMPTESIHMSAYTSPADNSINQIAFNPQTDIYRDFWQASYQGIFRANSVLHHIDTPDDLVPARRTQLEAETRFMRALIYFDLVRAFGGVPDVTSLLTIEEARDKPRASEDRIYEIIIDDLEFALSNLPSKGQIETGRATTGAAAALLGKVHIYLEDYGAALTYLNQVEQMDYTLLDDFSHIYSLDHEDHDEGIFVMKYLQNDAGHPLSSDFIPYFGMEGVSDTGNEGADLGWGLHKMFDDEDSRKGATITEYWRAPGSSDEPEYRPFISKFAVPHQGRVFHGSGLDLPVLRFADVILLKAEALYFEGDQSGALDYLNRIRERAYGNSDHNYELSDIASESDFIDVLLLERKLEFALENERWFDLVRTGRFIDELSQIERTPTLTVDLNVQPHHALFPIPQHEINQTEGVLEQNPGY
ncbi:MAG: RagB/SusD family nutrient uptake outer membrane protein [Balneolaceae bacterium]|nr:RagB/SusD family nutrient uptake outer membrane protein [Balneolaceae bacterium]